MAKPAAYLHFGEFDAYGKLDFERKEIRKAMRQAGAVIQREGRNLVSKGRVSKRDEYPGKRRGALYRSIRYKVSRPGFLVRIAPQKTAAMQAFYPAYLHYGVKAGRRLARLAPGQGRGKSNRRGKGERAAALASRAKGPWRVAPRKNFMEAALNNRRGRVQAVLRRGFAASLR